MFNPNYRYTHLARLITIVNGPLPGMQAIRRLDQNIGTTYFNDIFHGRTWPAYVQWFGLEDPLADIATDYAAEIYDADDFGDWLSSQKKIGSIDGEAFSPTREPRLRTELALDQYENSWLFGIDRTNLRRELSKNEFSYGAHYDFTGLLTRMHLTYALFARRRADTDKLYAYCLAQAIWSELNLKLFDLPRTAQFHPMPSPELLGLGDSAETMLALLHPSLNWSYDQDAVNWLTPSASTDLNAALGFVSRTQAEHWPLRAESDRMLQLLIGPSQKASLLSLCAPDFFRSSQHHEALHN
jgi:hypothetical protein